MKLIYLALFAAVLFAGVNAEIFFQDNFDDADFESRWVVTKDAKFKGTWKVHAGEFYADEDKQQGLATVENASHFGISASFPPVDFNTKEHLVLQMTVKHPQKIDCGGGYIKVLGDESQENFNGDTPYSIMFGPDICGPSNRKIHLIFEHNGKNLLWKKTPAAKTDQLTHVYTLILNNDNTYEVRVDGKKVEGGNLEDDWDFLEPKEIKDPNESKPSDWVDNAKIDDPEDSKPDDWDVPKEIEDPDAKMPDDWDEEDGEWEAPLIPNPEYKGEWKPKQIDNPDYKGPWTHPMIPNPEYVADDTLWQRGTLSQVGIEIWQVLAGTIFDNILITDSIEEAEEALKAAYTDIQADESAAFTKFEADKKAAAEKAAEDAKADDDEAKEDL